LEVSEIRWSPATRCGTLGSVWIDHLGSEVLPLSECLRLLALAAKEEGVGRLAVARPDAAPLVWPVNFAYEHLLVLVRIGEGEMADAASGALVAFETDRISREAGDAWSVLVRGLATETSEHTVANLGGSVDAPDSGHRILAIRADVVTGRRHPLG
jgi:hypothetical protein